MNRPRENAASSAARASHAARGFTLIELMVVIGIIVGVLALSVPVIRSLEGTRSIDAGYNKLASALGHARQLALYYRAPAGIVIYKDRSNGSGLYQIGFVTQEKNIPNVFQGQQQYASNNPPGLYQDDRYMDLIPGEEILSMPPGVGIQVITNPAILASGQGVQSNPNTVSQPNTDLGDRYLTLGMILFDEHGELSPSTQYFIRDGNSGALPGSSAATLLGTILQMTATAPTPGKPGGLTPPYKPGSTNFDTSTYGPTTYTSAPLYSHSAVCVYDEDAYKSQIDSSTGKTFGDSDTAANVADSISYEKYFQAFSSLALPPAQKTKMLEQTWLDQNGTVFVIKPNDGSLLRNQ